MSALTEDATGVVTGWRMGDVDNWATLQVRIGALAGAVGMTSRDAREFAINVLTEQGPYLGYQPPNEQMREAPRAPSMGYGRRTGERPGWRIRGDVDDLAERLAGMREQYGDEVFGWALSRIAAVK